MRRFGYRHCGLFFQTVFVVDDDGRLLYRGQHVPWEAIVGYQRNDDLFGYLSRRPKTVFFIRDGRQFAVLGWLAEEGRPPKRGFMLVPHLTGAYQDFVALVCEQSHAKDIKDLPEGKTRGLWLVAVLIAQFVAWFLFVVDLNFGLSLPLSLLIFGAPAAVVGWLLQKRLQRRCINSIVTRR